MKIPQINNASVTRAVNSTIKSSKKILKKQISDAESNGRKLLTTVMFLSSSLNPQLGNKVAPLASNIIKPANGDIFERVSTPGLIKDCIGNSKNHFKNSLPKTKLAVTAKNTLLTGSMNISTTELNVAFNNLLLKNKGVKNPMVNKAHVFISKGEKYGVNPIVLMAIAMTESARGTSAAAIKKNNVGGIMGRKSLRTFTCVEDCIDKMAETVALHHKKSHLNTLSELGYSGKYCDKSVAKEWINNVMFYIKKLS